MSNKMLSAYQAGLIMLDVAARAGQPFTDVSTCANADRGVSVQLTSRKSAKGWKGVISEEEYAMRPADFVNMLQTRWPDTFGEAVDPKEEKRAKIQLLAQKIAESGAQIAQQMSDLTKLIAELE